MERNSRRSHHCQQQWPHQVVSEICSGKCLFYAIIVSWFLCSIGLLIFILGGMHKSSDSISSRIIELASLPIGLAGIAISSHFLLHLRKSSLNTTVYKVEEIAEEASLDAYVIARLSEVDQSYLVVGREYTLEAGVSIEEAIGFASAPFTLFKTAEGETVIPFLIVARAEQIYLEPWQQTLDFYTNKNEPQLVRFKLRPNAIGSTQIFVDFYHERHWLQTVMLSLNIIESAEVVSV